MIKLILKNRYLLVFIDGKFTAAISNHRDRRGCPAINLN